MRLNTCYREKPISSEHYFWSGFDPEPTFRSSARVFLYQKSNTALAKPASLLLNVSKSVVVTVRFISLIAARNTQKFWRPLPEVAFWATVKDKLGLLKSV
jgi:hypothetical protein